ncbi:histidine kinase [Cytophagales bacterium LB-30]|uniref:Histidine kinase n=1 Tax=Shiella aurantiaca TaxID=3058365 RepID=A0ABT8F426_9BACT|nr:histidine kinase [Shiella aurantiaca]MDN4165205.1 histidine kinase [Shiella aurantiaca]
MKNRLLTLVLLGVIAFSELTAQATTDSLKSTLSSSTVPEDKLALLIELSQQYSRINADTALYYAKDATLLSLPDTLLADALGNYASLLVEANRLDEVEEVLNQAIKINESYNRQSALSRNYNAYGNYYFYKVNNEAALLMYRKSIEIEERLSKPAEYAKSLANFGIVLGRMGRDEEAKNTYLKALHLFDSLQDKGSALRVLVNLSSIFGMENKPYFSLDSSIYFGRKAVATAQQMQFDFGVAKAQSTLASSLIRKGYSDASYLNEGLEAATSATQFFKASPYVRDYQLSYLNQGYALEALGNTQQALAIADELLGSDFPLKEECHRLKYRAYKQRGDFSLALSHFESYKMIMDSIRDLRQKESLNEIQTKYESEKKDRAIEQLSQEAAIQQLQINQQKLLIGGIALVLVLIVILGILFYRQDTLKKEKKVADLEQRFLRAQMNPHFIFNALTSIQNNILSNEPKAAVSFLARFAKLMRNILEHSRQEYISLAEEVATLENYLEVQSLSFAGSFTYTLEVEEGIDAEQLRIPPMFAQPFIENALEHGLKDKKEGGHISVHFRVVNNTVQIEVRDNGKGIVLEANEKKPHNSLASHITKERLALYGKSLSQKLSLEVNNLKSSTGNVEGAQVLVYVPFKN